MPKYVKFFDLLKNNYIGASFTLPEFILTGGGITEDFNESGCFYIASIDPVYLYFKKKDNKPFLLEGKPIIRYMLVKEFIEYASINTERETNIINQSRLDLVEQE